jgi:hypothetical protein
MCYLVLGSPPLFEISKSQIGAHFLDNRREGLSEAAEVPMESATIHTEAARCLFGDAAAG